ncbi:unnamed protein product, partial [Ectocarpus fasciculatus]
SATAAVRLVVGGGEDGSRPSPALLAVAAAVGGRRSRSSRVTGGCAPVQPGRGLLGRLSRDDREVYEVDQPLLRLHGWRQVVLLVLLLRLPRGGGGGRGLLVGAAFRPAPRPPGVGHCCILTVSLLIETHSGLHTSHSSSGKRLPGPTQTRSPAEKRTVPALAWCGCCAVSRNRQGESREEQQ